MSKKIVKQFMDLGDKINVKIVKGNLSNPIGGDEFEFIVTGEFKNVSNSTSLKTLEKLVNNLIITVDNLAITVNNGFAKVNSRLDNVEQRLDGVEQRLDNFEQRLGNVEKDVKEIKLCPTIQSELKNKK